MVPASAMVRGSEDIDAFTGIGIYRLKQTESYIAPNTISYYTIPYYSTLYFSCECMLI